MTTKRYLTIILVVAISLGISDWLDLPDIFRINDIEFFQASAAKKKTKKNRKKRKKRSKSRKPKTTAKTAAIPAAEIPSNDSLTLAVNEKLIKLIPENHNPGGLRVNKVRTDSVSVRPC